MYEEIKIGKKPINAYKFAIVRNPNVTLKARGVNIKKAVDIAMIVERELNYKIKDVRIYDTVFEEDENQRHVSNIEIDLSR